MKLKLCSHKTITKVSDNHQHVLALLLPSKSFRQLVTHAIIELFIQTFNYLSIITLIFPECILIL